MSEAPRKIALDTGASTRVEVPPSRTGRRVRQLVDDVKADISDIEDVLRVARERASRLEEDAKGINGLSAACRGWGQQLDKMLDDLDEERAEVERKMLGAGRTISVRVDDDLQRRIAVARGA
jgi:chromosome segregation ATPase